MSLFDALPKHYDPVAAEAVYGGWEKSGYFSSLPQPDRENYSILLPPPNVTGTLHMGHAFQHTLMDILIRYQRMLGKNTLWQAGTDHAGIATQIVVTRELERRQIDVAGLSREAFLQHAWEWKHQSGSSITQQMRRLGTSCDWQRERFTLDDGLSAAVTEAFVRLYEEGLIYRGKRLVNWDPVLLTAVSDLEVVSQEESGVMYYVKYPFVDDEANGVVIGTTRPETILVDGAIAVHPDDNRYAALVGKKVWVPLTEPARAIEIIADTYVNPEFGSGCVKITAAHDFNDYEVHCRHADKNIPLIILFTPEAMMNDNAPAAYRGLDRFVARERIVADLTKQNLLIREAAHRYQLPRGDRSGVVVEPMLTDQWFLRMDPLAEKGIQLLTNNQLNFVPANWQKVYQQWLNNIHDWCISRQLMWGHQIPAWYDDEGNQYVARSAEEACQQAGGKTLRRDEDVLDTWFSSALWPFSTLNWPQTDNAHFAHYFPTSVLVTGFDIIFFWVARMAMMSEHFMNDVPFRDVYITGLVRDAEGQKMSKSRGNVLDPIDLVDGIDLASLITKRTAGLMNPKQEQTITAKTKKEFPQGIAAYGADALRFTFASLASYGRDIKFDISRCEGYRNFCNKLWNAARFVLGVCTPENTQPAANGGLSADELLVSDQWIISRLQRTEASVAEALAIYRFDLAAQAIYQFFWDDYCDWYLELAKVQLRQGDADLQQKTRQTLLHVLESGLRLCHPMLPFITEQLWQKVAPLCDKKTVDSIMLAPYPQSQPEKINEEAEAKMLTLMQIIEAARFLRNETVTPIPTLLIAGEGAHLVLPFIQPLSGIRNVRLVDQPSIPPNTLNREINGLLLALENREDPALLRKRLNERLAKMEEEMKGVERILANPHFSERAPANVVTQKKQQQARLLALQANLQEQLRQSDGHL